LRDATGETALFAVLDVHRVVIVDIVESHELLRTAPPIGMTTPTDTGALGRAMLAHLPPAELERVPGIRIDQPLLDELAAVRRRGWSQKARDITPGTVSLGAPVLDGERPIAALGITGPASRLPPATQRRAGAVLAAAAASLSDGRSV
jgi:IclR family acetate operon transcriptional repressor